MTKLITILEAASQIETGRLRPSELLEGCLEQIDKYEDRVSAWVVVDEAVARRTAQELDQSLDRGEYLGPLHGIPLGIKDIVDVEAERARLGKQANELARGISGIEGKLDNPGFLKKAPPEIVSRERERLGALLADLEAVRKSLEALG